MQLTLDVCPTLNNRRRQADGRPNRKIGTATQIVRISGIFPMLRRFDLMRPLPNK
jgi:hypothetical protein